MGSRNEKLVTKRLVLQPISHADVTDLAEVLWRDRDHLAPWVGVPDHELSSEEMGERVARLSAAFTAGTRRLYAVRSHGGDFVGCVGLVLHPERRTVELTYWLASIHTGRGLATESVARA